MSSQNLIPVNNRKRSLGLHKLGTRSVCVIKSTPINIKNVATPTKARSATNTPVSTKFETSTQAQSAPSNFTPYRLSLNKRLRDTMTKKRLEFHIAQQKEQFDIDSNTKNVSSNNSCETSTTQNNNAPPKHNVNEQSNDATVRRRKLIQEIEIVEEEMQSRQRHITKTNELQMEIKRWQNAFHNAVDNLQQNIEPYQEKFVLLNRMGINSSNLLLFKDSNE